MNWLKDNHMILNPGKFQAIIFHKRKENHTNQIKNIDQKEIKAGSKIFYKQKLIIQQISVTM